MWAQLIQMRMKPGKESELPKLIEQLRATEQADSGLVRSTFMQDQNDPSRLYGLVVFESEEAARARESDPRRQDAIKAVGATMSDIFEGDRVFVDLSVVAEYTGD